MIFVRTRKSLALVLVLGGGLWLAPGVRAQDASNDEPPPIPKGVEVMARGPVHEAFASPTAPPAAPKPVPKQPPEPVKEMPPEEKPEGDVVWIPGYWAWDDDRSDFLWVSGVWRVVPPGKQWVAGYWRQDGEQWQWVNGFWTAAAKDDGQAQQMTYMPQPPAPPAEAPPGQPPAADCFYVPGIWLWNGQDWAWRPGYWARVQPGYVWVPASYRWSPGGYLYIPGYWDLAVSRRGFMYAPVVIDYSVVGPTYVYTPVYAVRDTVVLDSLFIRPAYGVYYFGDYYGPRYREIGFESCVVYSRTHYDPVIVYERYERRNDPTWFTVQIDLVGRRDRGEAPVPPRTLVQQTTIVNNVNVVNVNNVNVNNVNVNNVNVNNKVVNNNSTVLMPARKLAAEKKIQVVKLDQATRAQAYQRAQAVQQVARQRAQVERASGGIPTRPRPAPMKLPPVKPIRAASEPRTTPAARTNNMQNTGPAPTPARGRNTPPMRGNTNTLAPRTNPTSPTRPVTPNQGYRPPQQNPYAPRTQGAPAPRPNYAPQGAPTSRTAPAYAPRTGPAPQGPYPPRPNGAAPANPAQRPANAPPPNRQPPPSNQKPPPNQKKWPPDKN